MKIAIIGTGYVGLVAGACFADTGNDVICVDNNIDKVEKLEKGIIPVFEPGLEELVNTNFREGRLKFSSELDKAVKTSEICFICVGTPQDTDGSADLRYVMSVAEEIADAMNGYKIIVDKSTVPVGTAEKISKLIKSKTKYPFDLVSNPEFLKQGNAVDDFMFPDRVIVGADSEKVAQIMQELYSPFLRTGNRVIVMDIKSAEMTKYTANAFLAAKISFMNEIANLCEKVGADVEMVRTGISADDRIGNKFLFPGIGYGGSCFPKDVNAIINTGRQYGCDMTIIEAVNETNQRQREIFAEKVINRFGGDLKGKTIAVWGLAFKPKTDDMRDAPSISIISRLLEVGANIRAYDPKTLQTAKEIFGDKICYCNNSYEAVEGADCLLLLTEWNEFRRPDFAKIKGFMKTPVIFDGRNQYNPKELKTIGFECHQIGRS